MNGAKVILTVVLFTSMAGVAHAQKVSSDYFPGGDFDSYKTFVWIQQPRDENGAAIRRAVSAQLTARGLKEVTSGPDIGVAANVANDHDKSLDAFYASLKGWNWHHWDQDDTASSTSEFYPAGTVVVDLFDAKTRRVVWRGIAVGAFSPKGGGADRFDKDLQKMFKSFPPKWDPKHSVALGGS